MFKLSRFTRDELHLGRLEAFSDGVFAIVVTLLVLDLNVPSLLHPTDSHELQKALYHLAPKFLSWLISFVIVCKFWINHSYVLSLARCGNYALVWINSIFLMFQSFIPFPTAMMGEYPHNSLAVSCFGVIMAFNTILYVLLYAYILHALIKPELKDSQVPNIIGKSFIGPVLYLVGAFAAWKNTDIAFLFYMVTPLFFITPLSKPVKPAE